MLLTLVLITVLAEAGNERRKVKRARGGRYLEKYEYLESGGKAERSRLDSKSTIVIYHSSLETTETP